MKKSETKLNAHWCYFLICAALFVCNSLQAVNNESLIGALGDKGSLIVFQTVDNKWGLKIDKQGDVDIQEDTPVFLQVYQSEARILDFKTGYTSITKSSDGFTGSCQIKVADGVSFDINDVWVFEESIIKMKRNLKVHGDNHWGYFSGISLATTKELFYSNVQFFAPGETYGDPSYLHTMAQGGKSNYNRGQFSLREENLPIPLCGMYFCDGTSISIFKPKPSGTTTAEETNSGGYGSQGSPTLIDDRFDFGAFGMNEQLDGSIELSYWYPGSLQKQKRYHPVKEGVSQNFEVVFRVDQDQTYHNYYKSLWRWGWNALHPQVKLYDMAVVQKSLIDHLSHLVIRNDDKVGVPFWSSMIDGSNFGDAGLRDRDAVMGFVGKDLEGAVMLIRASYEDNSARGKELYQTGVDMIESMIKYVTVSPPSGSGFNLETGKPTITNPAPNHVTCCNGRMYLRAFTDDMRWVLKAYEWELKRGKEHYDWFRWCAEFGEWLVWQQKEDGSFPRSWYPGTNQVYDNNYESSYNAMAFFVKLSQVTGGDKYWISHGRNPFLQAAIKAGDFCWNNFHKNELYVGGTLDNNNVQDKEAGTLSLEGYLALYQTTKDVKWLQRAKAAADYAETFIIAWNVPMPIDEKDENLHWKKGTSTIGANKITVGASGIDQWMAGDVDEYASLYLYTGDEHYKEVAKVLLHGSKNSLALPGRLYDYYEAGAQQEHWNIVFNRGRGRHRGALPWVTVNQITGILGLKDVKMELFNELTTKE